MLGIDRFYLGYPAIGETPDTLNHGSYSFHILSPPHPALLSLPASLLSFKSLLATSLLLPHLVPHSPFPSLLHFPHILTPPFSPSPPSGLAKLCTLGFMFIGHLVDFLLILVQAVGPADRSSYFNPYYGPVHYSINSTDPFLPASDQCA